MPVSDFLRELVATKPLAAIPKILSKYPQVVDEIIATTEQYPAKNLMARIHISLYGEPPKCSQGHYLQFNTFSKGYRRGCVLGNKCQCVKEQRNANRLQTVAKKTEQDPDYIRAIVEKRKATSMEKYGVDHYAKTAEYKESKSPLSAEQKKSKQEKTKQTMIEKYGVAHHMQLLAQQEKVKQTMLSLHGVEYPLQHPEILLRAKENAHKIIATTVQKIKTTNLETHGVEFGSQVQLSNAARAVVLSKDTFNEFVRGKTRNEVVNTLGISPSALYKYSQKYKSCELFRVETGSLFETQVAEFLTGLGVALVINTKTVIPPKELDIFVPSKNVAIELCGLYWHSENSSNRGKDYHQKKYQDCKDRGITLVTIFEDEWKTRLDIVKSKLAHLVGHSTASVYARKCKTAEISKQEAATFLTQNHIQGPKVGTINLGLFAANELVAVMTFGKPRYSTHSYELLRYATKVSVPGGASKLFKFFTDAYKPKSVVSYSDCRWGAGNLYPVLGMKKLSTTVSYFYTDYHKRFNRLQFQKHKLVAAGANSALTEWQIMQANGYDRIWDCGQATWVWNSDK